QYAIPGSREERVPRSVTTNGFCVDDLFVAAMYAVSHSVLLSFSSTEERRALLTERYPTFFALAIATADAKTGAIIQPALPHHVELNSEEFRLSICVLLCKMGSAISSLAFTPPLLPIYTHWLRIHCTLFSRPSRATEILQLINDIWLNRYPQFDHLLSTPPITLIDQVFSM
ncbi:hypothetical protein GCK32_020484, partial [Trichostrongylus colubriformis]